ncbi:hypothetical protein [Croceicoccus gelatinilyticus]|uniref:hypothetical protein n=1 Tax=Croceicoccus gelatinilyticus TaxID=2835536 RepID=UPI001BD02539|nr:hypothetical protein [Croceicoccus gelatinilyticus]MBS7671527.1 hypothetical protein [Croceicoccus gelatinilyticus]
MQLGKLVPGLYAILPAIRTEEGEKIIVNAADHMNRHAQPQMMSIDQARIQLGAVPVPNFSGRFEGAMLYTRLGPLNASLNYAIVPVDTDETNMLPTRRDPYNWIVFEIAQETVVDYTAEVLSVGPVRIELDLINFHMRQPQASYSQACTFRSVIEGTSELGRLFLARTNSTPGGLTLQFDEAFIARIEACSDPLAQHFSRALSIELEQGRNEIQMIPDKRRMWDVHGWAAFVTLDPQTSRVSLLIPRDSRAGEIIDAFFYKDLPWDDIPAIAADERLMARLLQNTDELCQKLAVQIAEAGERNEFLPLRAWWKARPTKAAQPLAAAA